MEVIGKIVEKMIEPIIGLLYTSIGRQFGYLVHCKENVNDFHGEVDKLRDAMGSVQTRVNEAKNNAEVVEKNVSKWLDEVQTTLTTMEEVSSRLQQGTENLRCVDACSRYRLGKEGKKKKSVVTKLIDAGKFDTVAHRRPLTGIWRSNSIEYESFDSRESLFKQIMEALKDDGNYKIGIHGMPGVGKTRMMKEVAQQAEKDQLFDEIAQVVVTENPNLKEIQQKLAEGLNLKLDKETEDARKGLLRDRLKNGNKILVMVDDVWNDEIKLEDLGIPATHDQTKGCKILLTSRKQDVCEMMGVPENYNFQIGVLPEAEAWSLFEKEVGDSIDPHESVAEAVCKECAGLPLAILAVGRALKNKSKQVWEDALSQLRNSTANNIAGMPGKLYSRIELSYNYLEPVDAKSIFLLCCLFPEDDEISIDDLVRYGVGMRLLRGVDSMKTARDRAHVLVDTLKISSLLLEGENENFVKMHDVIRDVAIMIASKEKDLMYLVKAGVKKWSADTEYERCKTISLRLNKDCVFFDDLKYPELSTLMLEGPYSLVQIQSSFLEEMEKLEVLYLRNIHISALPSSLKNLRMLSLCDCKLLNLACLDELKKLEILIISEYYLEVLAPEIGHLTHLRLLDLRNCSHLKILPSGVISSLSQLEELYFPNDFDGWTVESNASLVELNSLVHLVSLQVYVSNAKLLSLNELLFKPLIKFHISIGCKLSFFQIKWGHYANINPMKRMSSLSSKRRMDIFSSATRILILEGIPLKIKSSILMEKAEVLCLIKLKGLKDVFQETQREGFLDLKFLGVEDCDEMEDLFGRPKWILQSNSLRRSGSFSKLSVLEVTNCILMIYLFSAATAIGFPQLEELTINDCEIMEEIVRDDHESRDTISFHQLKRMYLYGLPNLRSFYANAKKPSTTECNMSTFTQSLFNDKVKFPALEVLEIGGLNSLTAMWDNQVVSCYSVVSGVEVTAIEEGGDEILMFPQLKKLKLENLPNLKTVCYNTGGSKKEEEEEGGGKILVFPQLNTMRLKRLQKLSSFCCSRGEERAVEESNIPQPQALFNHKVKFPCLEDLNISTFDNLKEIWDNTISTDSVSKLRNLELEGCHKLLNVASIELLTIFQNLEEVKVVQCDSMQEVFKIEGPKGAEGTVASDKAIGKEVENNLVFPRLNSMVFKDLPCLTSFWGRNCIYELQSAVRITVETCPKLQMFSCRNENVEFPNFEELVLHDNEGDMFEGILHSHLSAVSFSKVRLLELQYYHNLVNASTLLQWFEVGEELTVEFCWSLEVVFKLEELDICERKAIVSSQIKRLKLFSLHKLAHIWTVDSQRLLVFHNLTSLTVQHCNSLKYLLPFSIASLLTQLRVLEIEFCIVMEEIVRSEGQGEEDDKGEIVFPQLESLKLSYLPKLTCFCHTNNAFKFPSLKQVNVEECPELHAFTSGGISTPDIKVIGDDRLPRHVSDLNNYVQEYIRKGKGLVLDNDDEEISSEEEKVE